jgi:cytochrome c5
MMRHCQRIKWSLAGVALVLLAACAKPPEAAAPAPPEGRLGANPGAAAMQGRSASTPQEALFVEKCSMCHREMGMGTVILARRLPAEKVHLENRGDLTAELIAVAVRAGIGNMPRIPRGEVSDEQLGVIVQYLTQGKKP